jgi:hypothetical protein
MGAFTAQYTKKLARSKGRPLVTQETGTSRDTHNLSPCRNHALGTLWQA